MDLLLQYSWNDGKHTAKMSRLYKIHDLQGILLEKAMATHSSTLAWKIPWVGEPGRLQSMGSHRVGHDWAPSLSLSCIGEGNGNPLQCSCLENPRDRGAWWAVIYGVAQSRTWLKWLSSSSNQTLGNGLHVCHIIKKRLRIIFQDSLCNG